VLSIRVGCVFGLCCSVLLKFVSCCYENETQIAPVMCLYVSWSSRRFFFKKGGVHIPFRFCGIEHCYILMDLFFLACCNFCSFLGKKLSC